MTRTPTVGRIRAFSATVLSPLSHLQLLRLYILIPSSFAGRPLSSPSPLNILQSSSNARDPFEDTMH